MLKWRMKAAARNHLHLMAVYSSKFVNHVPYAEIITNTIADRDLAKRLCAGQ